MCGIVGYIGKNVASSVLVEGLKRLEYRGYDSAGVSVMDSNPQMHTRRATGRVTRLETKINAKPVLGKLGIGHTRWATHGQVTEDNAHPHVSSDTKFSLVHNGVIENHQSLKLFLQSQNYSFRSQTDSEVLVNLIAYYYAKESHTEERFLHAVRKSLKRIRGTYGIAVISTEEPGSIIGARYGSPLILGIGSGENLIASDVAAIASRTSKVIYLNDNEIVSVKKDDFSICTLSQENVEPEINTIDWNIEEVKLGNFAHYMEKEIFEQPIAVRNAMRGRFSEDESTAVFGGLNISPEDLRHINRIILFGCGTTWHAGLIAEHLIERFARIPCEVEYASEFRYRNAPLHRNTLVFVISQSGETIDTLASLREAKRKGYRVLGITNVVGSTIARESDGGIYQHAGPEVGVASTKAFTSQLTIVAMLALYLGRMRDMAYSEGHQFCQSLQDLPNQIQQILDQKEHIQAIAKRYSHYKNFLFMGRQVMFPIALEGALKLKEISYIHAEGYPSGEMKHGPIALVNKDCPSVFLAAGGETYHKSLANIQEVRARKGSVIVIVPENNELPEDLAPDTIKVPHCHDALLPILATIPVQLLAYYIAREKGNDIDKPRNLAKSVTVE